MLGVIPRAARGLFSRLATESSDKSNHGGRTPSGSGIRPPSRLSMQLSPTPTGIKPRIHKPPPSNKDWSLRATYVEVLSIFNFILNVRYTMTNLGTCFSLLNFRIRNVSL